MQFKLAEKSNKGREVENLITKIQIKLIKYNINFCAQTISEKQWKDNLI